MSISSQVFPDGGFQLFNVNNAFKSLFLDPIHKDKDGGRCFQLVFADILRVFNCVDLLDGNSEFLCHFRIDGSLFHAAHTTRLEKAEYTKSHEQESAPAIKKGMGRGLLLGIGNDRDIGRGIAEINYDTGGGFPDNFPGTKICYRRGIGSCCIGLV